MTHHEHSTESITEPIFSNIFRISLSSIYIVLIRQGFSGEVGAATFRFASCFLPEKKTRSTTSGLTRSHARGRAQIVYYLSPARARGLRGKPRLVAAHLALLLAGGNLSSASRAALQTVTTSGCSSRFRICLPSLISLFFFLIILLV